MPSRVSAVALALAALAASPAALNATSGPEAARPEVQAPEPAAAPAQALEPAAGESPARSILAALPDPALRDLATEVLARNPDLAAARARARAAEQEAPQARSLPDPMAGLTAFLLTPETRVGPQRAMVALSQRFPWFGKLGLREQAALYAAAAARADVAARELTLVTETRRLAYELAFLDAWDEILGTDRAILERYEELARTRYAAGIGLEQAVVKLQAELTKVDTRKLQLADRRAETTSALNALRDRSPVAEPPEIALPEAVEPSSGFEGRLARLEDRAAARRPELARAEAEVSRAGTQVELAKKDHRPDVTLGLTYTLVGERQDAPGRAMPPPDNGQDVIGLTASINLPVYRDRLDAAVEQAARRETAAREERRAVTTSIDRSLGELAQRLVLTYRELRLFEDVLGIQAEESLSSAEAAYSAGSAGALDLLDAERVLLDVRTSTARARADYAITLARLQGAVGEPIDPSATEPEAAKDPPQRSQTGGGGAPVPTRGWDGDRGHAGGTRKGTEQ